MTKKWDYEGLYAFMDHLKEQGYELQIRREELERCIMEWLGSFHPDYANKFKRALLAAGLIRPVNPAERRPRLYQIIR